jgi:hypothetical protein
MNGGAGGSADDGTSEHSGNSAYGVPAELPTPDEDELPTPDERRWALLAAQLPFDQLIHARAQAEGWRNALAASTGIIAAITLVRGRQDFSPLATGWKVVIVVGLLSAFAALVSASLVAIRAAHGRPGMMIQADGESLRKYVAVESHRVMRLLPWVAYLTVTGVTLILVTAVLAWLAPGGSG